MGKKADKITELSYSVGALEDEIEYLNETVAQKQGRIVELINENDRLTMAFDPYIPEDSEDYGLTFYGLKAENESLIEKIQEKMFEISNLRGQLSHYEEIDPINETKNPKNGCLSFDFWPLSDWVRLSLYRWEPGKAFQLCIGPCRLDWFEN